MLETGEHEPELLFIIMFRCCAEIGIGTEPGGGFEVAVVEHEEDDEEVAAAAVAAIGEGREIIV